MIYTNEVNGDRQTKTKMQRDELEYVTSSSDIAAGGNLYARTGASRGSRSSETREYEVIEHSQWFQAFRNEQATI